MKNKRKNKGAALVELILILPFIIAFMIIIWELQRGLLAQHAAIQALHYMTWEKVDTRNNLGDRQDPRPTGTVIREGMAIADVDDDLQTAMWLNQADSTHGILPGAVQLLAGQFGLNTHGKWRAQVRQRFYFTRVSVLNFLFEGDDIGPHIDWGYQESLLVDCWEVRRPPQGAPGGDFAHSITLARVSNAFYSLLGGRWFSWITRLLQFNLPMFGRVGVDEPRLNLVAVPEDPYRTWYRGGIYGGYTSWFGSYWGGFGGFGSRGYGGWGAWSNPFSRYRGFGGGYYGGYGGMFGGFRLW
jgi:hypothetical protein